MHSGVTTTFAARFRELLTTTTSEVDLNDLNSIEAIRICLTKSVRELLSLNLVTAGDVASLPPSPDRATNGLGLLVRAINKNTHIKKIKSINLAGCNLNDEDLLDLSRLTKSVGTIDLSGNNFTLIGCSHLITGLWDSVEKKATFERLSLLNPVRPLAAKFPLKELASYTAGKKQRYLLRETKAALSSSRTGISSTALLMAQADSGTDYGTNPLHAMSKATEEPTIYVSGADNYVHFIKEGSSAGGRGADFKYTGEDEAKACCSCTIM